MQFLLFLLPLVYLVQGEIYGITSKVLSQGDLEPPQMEKFRVHGMKFCPFTERVLIYMSKKNFRAEVVNINLASKPDWYLRKHKSGTVPTFQLVDVIIGRDSDKICELLDVIDPETSILPSDKDLRANEMDKTKELMDTVIGLYAEIKRYGLVKNQTDEGWKDVSEKLYLVRETLLPYLRSSKFLSGPTPGYMDYMAYPFVERLYVIEKMWSSFLTSRRQSQEITNWYNVMSVLPEVLAVRQSVENHVLHFESLFNGKVDYDAEIGEFPKVNELRFMRH